MLINRPHPASSNEEEKSQLAQRETKAKQRKQLSFGFAGLTMGRGREKLLQTINARTSERICSFSGSYTGKWHNNNWLELANLSATLDQPFLHFRSQFEVAYKEKHFEQKYKI